MITSKTSGRRSRRCKGRGPSSSARMDSKRADRACGNVHLDAMRGGIQQPPPSADTVRQSPIGNGVMHFADVGPPGGLRAACHAHRDQPRSPDHLGLELEVGKPTPTHTTMVVSSSSASKCIVRINPTGIEAHCDPDTYRTYSTNVIHLQRKKTGRQNIFRCSAAPGMVSKNRRTPLTKGPRVNYHVTSRHLDRRVGQL